MCDILVSHSHNFINTFQKKDDYNVTFLLSDLYENFLLCFSQRTKNLPMEAMMNWERSESGAGLTKALSRRGANFDCGKNRGRQPNANREGVRVLG